MKEHLRQGHRKDNTQQCTNCGEPIQLDDHNWVHCEEEADANCEEAMPERF